MGNNLLETIEESFMAYNQKRLSGCHFGPKKGSVHDIFLCFPHCFQFSGASACTSAFTSVWSPYNFSYVSSCQPHSLLSPSLLPFLLLSLFVFFLFFYINTSWAPYLKMSPKHFTMATRALFSAYKQTHCTVVICILLSDCSFTYTHESGCCAV